MGFIGSVEGPVDVGDTNSQWSLSAPLCGFSLAELSCLAVRMQKADIYIHPQETDSQEV